MRASLFLYIKATIAISALIHVHRLKTGDVGTHDKHYYRSNAPYTLLRCLFGEVQSYDALKI